MLKSSGQLYALPVSVINIFGPSVTHKMTTMDLGKS